MQEMPPNSKLQWPKTTSNGRIFVPYNRMKLYHAFAWSSLATVWFLNSIPLSFIECLNNNSNNFFFLYKMKSIPFISIRLVIHWSTFIFGHSIIEKITIWYYVKLGLSQNYGARVLSYKLTRLVFSSIWIILRFSLWCLCSWISIY